MSKKQEIIRIEYCEDNLFLIMIHKLKLFEKIFFQKRKHMQLI